jgi:hypothetical protein
LLKCYRVLRLTSIAVQGWVSSGEITITSEFLWKGKTIMVRSSSQRHFSVFLFILALIITSAHPGLSVRAATTRYVSVTGNDSNPGTLAQPYRTIQRCANESVAGDTCLIRGGNYRETVTPPNSGNAGQPITFAPYNGETAIVDGTDLVTGWSVFQGNIYSANVTLPVTQPSATGPFFANQIFVGDQMMTEAQWPNLTSGDPLKPAWAVMDANSSNTTIYDSALPSLNFAGSTLHVWAGTNPFGNRTMSITSSSGGQLNVTGISGTDETCPYLCPREGGFYFAFGALSLLDVASEWYYDGTKLYLYAPGGVNPNSLTVRAKQRNYAFNLQGRSYITINGLQTFGNTITVSGSNNILENLNARYISHHSTIVSYDSGWGILRPRSGDTGIILAGTNNTLRDSRLQYSAANGVLISGEYNTVTNNVISDVNYMGTYASGIQWFANHSTITYNTLFHLGHGGIEYDWGLAGANYNTVGVSNGKNSNISYNHIYDYLLLATDKGGLYICCSVDGTGTDIHHNVLHDATLAPPEGNGVGVGIYLDNRTFNYRVYRNVVFNVAEGLRMNGIDVATNNKFFNNTLDTTTAIGSWNPGNTGVEIRNNIFRGPNEVPGGTQTNNLAASTDPQFVNPGGWDYSLQSTSPAINAGVTVSGITTGYTGSAPDQGAYESSIPMWGAGARQQTHPAGRLIHAERYSTQSGVTTSDSGIGSFDSGDSVCFNNVDFGSGATSFRANIAVDPAYAGAQLQVRINGTLGTLLGTLTVQTTGGWDTYAVQSTTLSNTTGVHQLCLVIAGGGTAGNLDWVQLTTTRNAFAQVEAESYNTQSGVNNYGTGIGALDTGDWACYTNVNFGGGATVFQAHIGVPAEYAGKQIQVRLNSNVGTLLGTLTVQSTGDWGTLTTQSTSITSTSGTQTVCLAFIGGYGAGNLDWIKFTS